MGTSDRLAAFLKKYPYKERLTNAAPYLIAVLFVQYKHIVHGPYPTVVMCAVALTFLCEEKGRTYYYLWGIAGGIILALLLGIWAGGDFALK